MITIKWKRKKYLIMTVVILSVLLGGCSDNLQPYYVIQEKMITYSLDTKARYYFYDQNNGWYYVELDRDKFDVGDTLYIGR